MAEKKIITVEIDGNPAANTLNSLNQRATQLKKALSNLDPNLEPEKVAELSKEYEKVTQQIESVKQATGLARQETSKFQETLANLTKATFWLYIAQLIYEWGKAFLTVAVDVKNLRAEIGNLTNATGNELDKLTTRTQALAKTFGADAKDIALSANNFAKQMGISYNEAFDLIEKGFVNGANASGEFLDKLKEYPVQFKEAGISQETFIKAATMEVKEGVYSDKFLDTIKEVGLSLREMTKAQQDALTNAFGGQFTQKLLTDINNGTVTTEQAYQRIMQQADKTGLSVQQMQVLTADVFKGAGEDVGGAAKIWDIYKDVVASSLEPQNEYAKKQREILASENEVAAAQNEFAKVLEKNTGGLQKLTNKGIVIATKGFTMLFEKVFSIGELVFDFIDNLGELGKEMGLISDETDLATTALNALSFVIDILLMPLRLVLVVANNLAKAWTFVAASVGEFIATSPRLQAFFNTIGEYLTSIGAGLRTIGESFEKAFAMIGLLPDKKTVEIEVKVVSNGKDIDNAINNISTKNKSEKALVDKAKEDLKEIEQLKITEEEKNSLRKNIANKLTEDLRALRIKEKELLTEENKKAAEAELKEAQKLAEQKMKDAQKAYDIEQKMRIDSLTNATEKAKAEARIQAEKQDLEIQQLQISEEKKAQLRLQLAQNLAAQITKIETDAAKTLDDKIKELEEKLALATAEYNKTTQDVNNRNVLGTAQGNVTAAEMTNDPQKIFEAKMNLLAEQQAVELQNLELTEGEKFAIEQKYAQQRLDLEKSTAEAKRALLAAQMQDVENGVTAFGEAIGKQTEIGRAAIQTAKALNAAQVTMSSIVEIQEIWKNAQTNPLNAIIPGWGTIYAAAATAAAVGRSMKAIADINSVKYADGGLLQGASHAAGGIPINVGGKGFVEAEGGEMIVNKRATENNMQAAFMLNKYGANTKFDLVPKFATGGMLPDTTPRMPGNSIMNSNDTNSQMSNVMETGFMLLADKLDQYEAKQVFVNYTDIESAGGKVAAVRTD